MNSNPGRPPRFRSFLRPLVPTILLALSAATAPLPAQAGKSAAPEIRKNLVYGTHADKALKLDVYRPRRPGRLPAVLVFHGGGWYMGGKSASEAPMFAMRLAEAGYVAISAAYRLAPDHLWPAQLDDVRRAAQYVRSEATTLGIDPSRIAALGTSAGGHLAAFLAVSDDIADPGATDLVLRQSSRVDCAVSICGPMDFETRDGASKAAQATVLKLLTGTAALSDKRAWALAESKLKSASPVSFVGAGDSPVFLAYGDKDTLVRPVQTFAMERALLAAKVPHELFCVKDGGHADFIGRLSEPAAAKIDPLWTRVLSFLIAHMKSGADVASSRPAAPESRPSSRPVEDAR